MGRWKLNGEEIEETGYRGVRKSERLEIRKRRRRMKERSEMEGTRRGRGIGDREVRVGRRGGQRDQRSGSKKVNDEDIEEIRDWGVRKPDERRSKSWRAGSGSRVERRSEGSEVGK